MSGYECVSSSIFSVCATIVVLYYLYTMTRKGGE